MSLETDIELRLDTAKGELVVTLVSAGEDLAKDNKIRGQILGLELAKSIIHSYFEELSDDGDEIDND